MPYISCEKDVKSASGHNIFELIEKVELCRPSKQGSNTEENVVHNDICYLSNTICSIVLCWRISKF